MIEGFLTRTPLLRPFRWTGYGNLAKTIFTLGCPTQSPHFTWPWTLHVPTLQFCNESIQHFITFTWHRIHLFKIYFPSNVLSFSEDYLPFSVEFLQISRLGRRESQIILSWSHTKMSPICMWDRKTTRCTINFVMQGRRKKTFRGYFLYLQVSYFSVEDHWLLLVVTSLFSELAFNSLPRRNATKDKQQNGRIPREFHANP